MHIYLVYFDCIDTNIETYLDVIYFELYKNYHYYMLNEKKKLSESKIVNLVTLILVCVW